MTTRAEIVAAAREQLATPWVHQGRLPGVALDCIGLVIVVARRLGFVAPDFDVNGYKREPDGVLLPAGLREHLVQVPKHEMAPGDVVVMAFDKSPQHVGIVVPYRNGGLAMVHAASRAGEVEETRLMFTDKMRFTGAYSFPGVAAWVR